MNPSDQRLFAIANAFHDGYTIEKIHDLTKIDKWFLHRLENIINMERTLTKHTPQTISVGLLRHSKEIGFSDSQLAKNLGTSELAVRKLRVEWGITPFVKQIDTGKKCKELSIPFQSDQFSNVTFFPGVQNDCRIRPSRRGISLLHKLPLHDLQC